MPNGILPISQPHSYRSRATYGYRRIALRIRTRWQRRQLDEELSRGADPATSGELALRAAQLRSSAVRSQLADALSKSLDDARGPEPLSLKLQPHRAEIRDCADDILALVRRLRDEQPVDVRGAAMTARLLSDRSSPLDRSSGESLRHAVRSALLALGERSITRRARAHAA